MKKSIPYFFLAPALLFFTCLSFIPMLYAFGLALFKEDYGRFTYNGFNHFQTLITDPEFGQALLNTFLYALITIPAGLSLALGCALLLQHVQKGRTFWRALYFTPAVTITAAIGYIWLWMYDPHKGLLNQIWMACGGNPISFLNNTGTALLSVAAVRVWAFLGFHTVIFLAGLQAIPGHLYEAAQLEGANRWQEFRHITVPMLNPTIVFLVIIGSIKTLQMFTEIYIMTDNGGPLGATRSIVYLIQQTAFSSYQKGYAAAMTVVLFIIILIFTVLQYRLVSRESDY